MQHNICVFCGANPKIAEKYFLHATQLGKMLAEHKYNLVYGGGGTGLMGALAESMLASKGRVIGIYPEILPVEPIHPNLSEVILVQDLGTRKKLMLEKSDAFLALPGGFGTLDEIFEVITWNYLNRLGHIMILYNQDGYYNELIAMTEKIFAEQFADLYIKNSLQIADSLEQIFTILQQHLVDKR